MITILAAVTTTATNALETGGVTAAALASIMALVKLVEYLVKKAGEKKEEKLDFSNVECSKETAKLINELVSAMREFLHKLEIRDVENVQSSKMNIALLESQNELIKTVGQLIAEMKK